MSAATTEALGAEGAPAVDEADGRLLRVRLDAFEGPLDLLLHLIQKHELDIFDVPIAFITEEYLRYLDAMVRLDLGVVGEYLVMAATLIQIKSAMLLPKPPRDDEEEDEGDPREALIRRLLEYQRFKDAAARLLAEVQLYRDTFPRPPLDEAPRPPRTLDELEAPGLFELIEVFQALIKKHRNPVMHEVSRHELSIKDAIHSIAGFLDATPRTTLRELMAESTHADPVHRVVITFMALLEMAKLRLITLFQARITSDDLIVERAVVDIAELALTLDFSEPEHDLADPEDAASSADPASTDGPSAGGVAEGRGTGADTEPPPPTPPGEADADAPSYDTAASHDAARSEEDALLDAQLQAMRGRPRLVRNPTLDATDPRRLDLEREEAELLALTQLHSELDDYDVELVLAQAMALSGGGGENVSDDSRVESEDADVDVGVAQSEENA